MTVVGVFLPKQEAQHLPFFLSAKPRQGDLLFKFVRQREARIQSQSGYSRAVAALTNVRGCQKIFTNQLLDSIYLPIEFLVARPPASAERNALKKVLF